MEADVFGDAFRAIIASQGYGNFMVLGDDFFATGRISPIPHDTTVVNMSEVKNE